MNYWIDELAIALSNNGIGSRIYEATRSGLRGVTFRLTGALPTTMVVRRRVHGFANTLLPRAEHRRETAA